MCTNGVNTGQLEDMIAQIDDHVALEYRWSHKLAHLAADGGLVATGEKLHQAQAMLAEVRSILGEVRDGLEDDAVRAAAGGTEAHLV